MPFIVQCSHQAQPVCFLSHERDEWYAIFRAYSELFFSLGDDHTRAEDAIDEIREMTLEQLKAFKFNTDVYHYRAVLAFSSIREISDEQYAVLNELSNDLGLTVE